MKINREYLSQQLMKKTNTTKISDACLKAGKETGIKASTINNFRLYGVPNEERLLTLLKYLDCDLNKLFNVK